MLCLVILSNCNKPVFKKGITWLIAMKRIVKLAWNLPSKTCVNLLDFINTFIFYQEFLEQSRQKSTDFSRHRKLPFAFLILFFCNFLKSSYQAELNKFFKILSDSAIAKRVVSKTALCKARRKIKYQALTMLDEQAVTYFNQSFTPQTWHGFFLKAVDGSTIQLPDSHEMKEHFGAWNPRQGKPVPMARISKMFDPLNKITIHALIDPKGVGEREMAASHFEQIDQHDLILLDRGCPAFWIFKLILSRNAHFCAGIFAKKWKIIRKFIRSGKPGQLVAIEVPVLPLPPAKSVRWILFPCNYTLFASNSNLEKQKFSLPH